MIEKTCIFLIEFQLEGSNNEASQAEFIEWKIDSNVELCCIQGALKLSLEIALKQF